MPKTRALIWLEKGKPEEACEDLNTATEWGYTAEYGGEVDELMQKHCK